MNKILLRLMQVILFSLFNIAAFAQQKNVEMADIMRSNGKIYTVVAVCLTILTGLFLYVFTIDRKLKKIEKDSRR